MTNRSDPASSLMSSGMRYVYVLCAMMLALLPGRLVFAGDEAPDFSLPGDTGQITLAGLRGQVVYLDFWASWCGPCRKSFPWMNEMSSKYGGQGFTIVAVNLDTDRALMEKFLAKYPAHFSIAYDPAGEVAEAYQVRGMPSSYLIDRDGRIHSSHLGFREDERTDVEAEIRVLLQKHPGK